MLETLMVSHFGPTLLAALIAGVAMQWCEVWRTRRTWCLGFLCFQLTSSLGTDVIYYFVRETPRRLAYYMVWNVALAALFLFPVVLKKDKPRE